MVYKSSVSSAEVYDRLCVILSVLGERNDILAESLSYICLKGLRGRRECSSMSVM